METRKVKQTDKEVTTAQAEAFTYQLEILQKEIETTNDVIGRMDEITQTTKNWAIVTWGGSIGLMLREPTLRPYIIFTVVIPLLFWYIDGRWRHLQARTIYRVKKIHEFLNDERLTQSFEQKKLIGFKVLDLTGQQYKDTDEYKQATSTRRTLRFAEVRMLYFALAVFSVLIGVFFYFSQ